MISVFILDHAAERGSSVIAVDQTNLIDARLGIAKRPVYTAHRFIAHEAVKIYGIILYLTMMIEVYYREYETESQYFWAKDQLMTVWSDDAPF